MTPEEAWREGVSLEAAFGIYADRRNWNEYRQFKPGILMFAEALPVLLGDDEKARDEVTNEAIHAGKLRSSLEAEISSKLRAGELLAYGYAMPRSATDKPVLVPVDVWQDWHKVKFEQSTVKGNGLEFISLKVVPGSTRQLSLPPVKQVGRPSIQRDIFEVYELLKEQGFINFSGSMNIHFDLIRDKLCLKHPDKAGVFQKIADETIRRVITNDFKANKQ